MNWSNLPSHILHNIFSNQSVREQKTSSLISRRWYKEIAWLWRKDIELRCSRLEADNNWMDLFDSERYYENLIIDDCIFGGTPCAVIKTIMTKDNCGAFNGLRSLSFYSEVESIKLYKIISLTNDSLHTLEIDYPLVKCEDKFVPSLERVERLKIAINSDIPGILVNFRRLKSLQLDVDKFILVMEGLEKFINLNQKTLEVLNISFQCKEDVNFKVNLKVLKKLSLQGNWFVFKKAFLSFEMLESLELIDVNIDDAEVKALVDLFVKLKKLSIHCNPPRHLKCLQSILKLKDLAHLQLGKFYLENSILELELKAVNLKHLEISDIRVNEELLETIFKITPNLETLIFFKVRNSVFTTTTFKNIESLLPRLKTLKFIELNVRKGFEDITKMTFSNLKTLHLESSTFPDYFLKHFNAPNLEDCSMSVHTGSDSDDHFTQLMTWLSENCPKIQSLGMSCFCYRQKNIPVQCIKEIARKFKHLRKFHSGNHMTVECLEVFLKESKLLNYCLFNCERMSFGNVYGTVKRICEGKRTSVLNTNEEYKIFVDDLEIEVVL